MDWHKGNPDIIHDAALAQAAYSGTGEVHGWQRDMELSGPDRSVYHKDGKVKIAIRGTNPRNKRDLGTDVLVGLGLLDVSSRAKNTLKTTDRAIQKYGKENVSLVGHSLGGSLAAHVSRKRGLSATGFNAAMGPIDTLRKRTYGKFHSVSTRTDPISHFTRRTGRIGKQTITKATKWDPHTLSNYI